MDPYCQIRIWQSPWNMASQRKSKKNLYLIAFNCVWVIMNPEKSDSQAPLWKLEHEFLLLRSLWYQLIHGSVAFCLWAPNHLFCLAWELFLNKVHNSQR